MPIRKTPIITGEYYHVFNRSIARQPIFLSQKDYQRALNVLAYYRYSRPPIRFSYYNRLMKQQKKDFFTKLIDSRTKQIQILAYCLMPNHVHFLLRETQPVGIATFMSNIQNSYAKYFNLKHKRTGSLFQAMFKAVHIETDEQLLHVIRYIHLNPLTSYVIRDTKDLYSFQWSSFNEYATSEFYLVDPEFTMTFYKSIHDFEKFTLDQVDYQRQLDNIKHLTFD